MIKWICLLTTAELFVGRATVERTVGAQCERERQSAGMHLKYQRSLRVLATYLTGVGRRQDRPAD